MTNPLGRLKKIDVRDIWRTEAQDFTPWLAESDNLAVLADTLNMELEIEAQEMNVGRFRADILCKDTLDSSWVLIENQLERTDHKHLGQLMTYAAGLHAVTIVWISTLFTDEHRAALDWLNEITNDKFKFFGLEVELWQIGDSPAAPKFNVVSKPNEWSRSVGHLTRRIETDALSELNKVQLQFWTELQTEMNECSSLRPQKPHPQHWTNFSIGRTGFQLGATLNSRENNIGIELLINHQDAKTYYQMLWEDRLKIEDELGFSLDWLELPNRKSCRIVRFWKDVDPQDQNSWPKYRQWMIDSLERLKEVFGSRVQKLDAADFMGNQDEN